jgi:flagella basal body P-ring formation protein FlgA
MKQLHLVAFYCVLPLALAAQPPCLTVTGDQILGSDLARAIPAFAAVPRSVSLAPSPLPGGTRIFSLSELQSLAARFSVAAIPSSDVCFHFATEVLNRDRAEEAMRKSLQITDARIEILETSTGQVPVGVLQFARNNLAMPATPDQHSGEIWRGEILYAGNRRFPVWAKVRITVPVSKLVAAEALRPGVPIRPEQVRFESGEGFPGIAAASLSADQVAGMLPLRSVAAGAELRADNLTRPNDVNRGDLVHVEVRFGAAHLALTGRAESAGHIGDTIAVRNPDTSKIFQALVDGTDAVIVSPAAREIARNERN